MGGACVITQVMLRLDGRLNVVADKTGLLAGDGHGPHIRIGE